MRERSRLYNVPLYLNLLFRHRIFSEHDAPLIFFHIPRTGGTTFTRHALLPLFNPRNVFLIGSKTIIYRDGSWDDLRNSSKSIRRSIELVAGHVPFAAEQLFADPRYITMLRDPVQRAISDYYFCQNTAFNPAHKASMELDINEFCRLGFSQMQNCLTRHLSDAVYGEKYSSDHDMLTAAKANLERCFFFGLTERFEDSVSLFYSAIGLKQNVDDIPKLNMSTQPKDIPDGVRKELARYNVLDLELYRYACARFEERANKKAKYKDP